MGFFKRLFGSGATSAQDCYERGLAQEQKTDHLKAIADFTEAIRLKPDYADAYYARGLVHEILQYFDHAIEDFESVLRLQPDDLDNIAIEVDENMESGRVVRMPSEDDDPERGPVGWELLEQGIQIDIARVSAQRGMSLVDEGNYNLAIEEFSKALQLDPQLPSSSPLTRADLHFERGRAYCETGQFEKAVADLNEVIKSNPKDKELCFHNYLLLGKCYLQLQKNEKAISHLNFAIRFNAQAAEAYFLRGSAHVERNEPEAAIADFSQAIGLEPTLEAYLARAGAYVDTKQYDQAIPDLNEAVALNPEVPFAYVFRAQAYRALGDEARAKRDDDRAQAANYLPQALEDMKQGNWDQALFVLSEVIRLDPKQYRAYLRRGMVYNAKQEPDRAIADFNYVIENMPKPTQTWGPVFGVYTDVFANRGNSFVMKQEFARAIADYTEALRLEPKLAPVYEDRAQAYREIGEIEKAMHDERRAQELRG